MRKINLILIILSIIFISLSLLSCKNNNGNEFKYQFEYNEDFKIELDDETKEDIINKIRINNWYRHESELKWSNPEIKEEINSEQELDDLIESHTGLRAYCKIGDTYVICLFSTCDIWFTVVSISLYYNDISLIDDFENMFCGHLEYVYLYTNGELINVKDEYSSKGNINNFMNICEEDAIKIKNNNDSYNYYYFERYIKEEDYNNIQSSVYNAALTRIKHEIYIKNNPTTTTSQDQDTEITISHS